MNEEATWKEQILKTLSDLCAGDTTTNVKALRKMILMAQPRPPLLLEKKDDQTNNIIMDNNNKDAKKMFKRTVQAMERDNLLKIASNGQVTLLSAGISTITKKKRKHKAGDDDDDDTKDSSTPRSTKQAKMEKASSKKKKKKVKKETKRTVDANDSNNPVGDESVNHTTDADDTEGLNGDDTHPSVNNPSGATRLFVGNLPFKVDETSLGDFLPGITHIKWITDMETGRFYGSAFVEMKNPSTAGLAVLKSGQTLLGRPIKVNFAPPRPGDTWPPTQTIIRGNGDDPSAINNKKKKTAGGMGITAMGEKPIDCHKLFVGNLSYDIDDDVITKFFATVDAEVKAIRWIHHKDTGFFKGVGFIEFWNTEACEKAATLNGKSLLGRPIRIDWTD